MSFNVGSGLLTGHINHHRLHGIKEASSSPETNLWEKIKHFFFTTHQQEAQNCVHRLYHHESLKLSEEEIRETFIQLKYLASPGCRNKFVIDGNHSEEIFKIDNEIILSLPKKNGDDIWYDCESGSLCEDEIWYDCQDSEIDNAQEQWQLPGQVYEEAPEEAQEVNSDIDVWLAINMQKAEEIAPQNDDGMRSDERLYLQSVYTLMPKVQDNLHKIGKGAIIKKLGVWKSIKAQKIAERIDKKMHSQIINAQSLKKDIDSLLKIPKLMSLLPPEITEMAEFSVIQGH